MSKNKTNKNYEVQCNKKENNNNNKAFDSV